MNIDDLPKKSLDELIALFGKLAAEMLEKVGSPDGLGCKTGFSGACEIESLGQSFGFQLLVSTNPDEFKEEHDDDTDE